MRHIIDCLILFIPAHKKVPVLDHWWQTETGHPITSTCVGLGHSLNPPRDSSGVPVPGYNGNYYYNYPSNTHSSGKLFFVSSCVYHCTIVCILNSDREEAERGQLGRIVVKLPLPPGNMSTLFRADDRFASVYFKEYPVIFRASAVIR